MPVHLLIDGYNLLGRMGLGTGDFDAAREDLLNRLSLYGKERRTRITVVFDAYNSISLDRTRENHRGVEVIFSRRNETADDFIREKIRTRQTGLVVVSSDRAIIDEAKTWGVTFLTADRLENMMASRDIEPEEEGGHEKKGNPRKLPKNLRRAKRTIRKI